ncbi:MAG: histidine phosphatase family protein [Fusobacteriaceae bacterium]
MIKIYFVRHGQTQWNREGKFQGSLNSPLTEEGVNQANRLANKFESGNFIFNKVYSSPLGRAFNTAELITKYKQEIIPINEFREISVGDMEGVIFQEFKTKFPDEYHNFFHNPTVYNPEKINGESFPSLMERIELGLKKIVEENICNSNVLVVTHGIALRGIISYIKTNSLSIERFVEAPVPENTSVTTIVYKDGKFSIEDFSNIDHL